MRSIHTVLIVSLLIIVGAGSLFAAPGSQEMPWSAELSAGGAYIGEEGTGELGLALSRRMGSWYELGITGKAMTRLDHGEEDALGKEYHMESSYAALRFKPTFELSPRWMIALNLEAGGGVLTYRYEHKYAEEMRWDEEILDTLNYAVYNAGGELAFQASPRYSLFLRGGVRATSPIKTDLADENELSGFWSEMGLAYRF